MKGIARAFRAMSRASDRWREIRKELADDKVFTEKYCRVPKKGEFFIEDSFVVCMPDDGCFPEQTKKKPAFAGFSSIAFLLFLWYNEQEIEKQKTQREGILK
jgi:hypothetical protein